MDIALGSAAVTLPPLDVLALSERARIDALIELQRARSWVDAAEQRLLASLVEPGDAPRDPKVSKAIAAKQYVREEIACALRVAPMTVNDRLHTARTLVGSLPTTLAALERGEITPRHARVLVDGTDPLDESARTAVEARVIARASQQTPTEFRRSVTRAALAADPRGADERHETAREQRRVETRMLEDGMGSLYAVLPAEDLQAVREAVQSVADGHPAHDEQCHRDAADDVMTDGCDGCASRSRSADQRRADALVSLVLQLDAVAVQTRHGRRPTVQVSVALSTLLGIDEQPGELDGYGPVPAGLARRMAGDPSGTWRRLVTDEQGHLVDYGRTTYRPPQDLTDHVIARDRYCRFPGCGRLACTCELDHLIDWDLGGWTNQHNMIAGCPRHHHLRHEAGWTVVGDPEGFLTWTTPTGHSYDDPIGTHPVDTTMATKLPDPPPATGSPPRTGPPPGTSVATGTATGTVPPAGAELVHEDPPRGSEPSLGQDSEDLPPF